ncbi:MAG TPA: twin-arginine translocase subunit TatC [Devosiaceae bacterium]|jgi:sec-independent protein translocase protein TatC|nr:twin-arginine translocase subunit TatC [Devosiaceae bacterium]
MADAPKLAPPENEEDELAGSEMPLLDHLIELRQRLIYSLVTVGVLCVVCFIFARQIFDFLLGPFRAAVPSVSDVHLIYTAPQEYFFTELSVALFAAVFLAFPMIASQIYMFVAPGLYKRERKAFVPYLVATPIFFLLGAALVYFIVAPMALHFFLSMQETDPNGISITMQTRVSEYLSFIMTLILAFGVCFQLPVILTLLARIGIVGSTFLKKGRKYAVVVFLIISALLAPPDPFSQVGLTLPLYLLYEVSIQSVAWVERQRAAKEAAEKAALGL